MDERQKRQKERFQVIVVDSADRDTSKYPYVNDFVVQLAAPIRNAQGARLLKSEWMDYASSNVSSSTFGSATGIIVVGDATATVSSIAIGGAATLPTTPTGSMYVSLNGYDLVKLANRLETPIFARLSQAYETYPLGCPFMEDPNTFVINPVDVALTKFHVKLLDGKGSLASVTSTSRIILTLGFSYLG